MSDLKLRHVARECVEEADGSLEQATRLLRKCVDEDAKLLRALVEPVIEEKCRDLCREMIRGQRPQILGTIHPKDNTTSRPGPRHDNGGGIGALGLLNFPLPIEGQPRLKDAGLEQLTESIGFYRRQARTETARALWLEGIRKALAKSGKKKVSQALDDAALRALFLAAEKRA